MRRLLQGKALAPEDIAEIISLRDNTDSPESYATALEILNRAQVSGASAWHSALVDLMIQRIFRTLE